MRGSIAPVISTGGRNVAEGRLSETVYERRRGSYVVPYLFSGAWRVPFGGHDCGPVGLVMTTA